MERRGVYTRRQFLGGVGALGAAVAVPLPRAWLRPRLRSTSKALRVVLPEGRSSAVSLRPLLFSDDFRRDLAGSRLWRWDTFSGVEAHGTTAFGQSAGATPRLGGPRRLDGGMRVSLNVRAGEPSISGRMRTLESFNFEAGRRYRLELSFVPSGWAEAGGAVRARLPGIGVSRRLRLPVRQGDRPVVLEFTPARTARSPVELVSLGAPGTGVAVLDSVQLRQAA